MTALSSQRAGIKRRGIQARADFATETQLCAVFAASMRATGWYVYPETAGFDLLLVRHDTGMQLGIQAKLALNNKVCDQILANVDAARNPDFRGVLVPAIGASNAVLAKMLDSMRVRVFAPVAHKGGRRTRYIFENTTPDDWPCWHNGSADRRLPLPRFSMRDLERMSAGVPSPTQLTPWKERVLALLALLHVRGHAYRSDVLTLGLNPESFCPDMGTGYLRRLDAQRWALSDDSLPRLDEQFPYTFADLVNSYERMRRRNHGVVSTLTPAPAPAPDRAPIHPEKPAMNNNEIAGANDNEASYTINNLRGDLASTIRALRTGSKDMSVDKAKAIGDLAQVMINSAKVELEALKITGAKTGTGFMPSHEAPPKPQPRSPLQIQRELRDTMRKNA